jgi:hypothetical protein
VVLDDAGRDGSEFADLDVVLAWPGPHAGTAWRAFGRALGLDCLLAVDFAGVDPGRGAC